MTNNLIVTQLEHHRPETAGPITNLLSRLDDTRETGAGRWIARCPAHADRSPSLSIRECDDGTVLVHCFAGCSAADVVEAIGLELRDLFPGAIDHHLPPKTRHQRLRHGQALDALRALTLEALIVLVAAETLAAGRELDDDDRERLGLAEYRIRTVRELVI